MGRRVELFGLLVVATALMACREPTQAVGEPDSGHVQRKRPVSDCGFMLVDDGPARCLVQWSEFRVKDGVGADLVGYVEVACGGDAVLCDTSIRCHCDGKKRIEPDRPSRANHVPRK